MAQGQINQDVSADEGLRGRNVLICLTLCYVRCSISSLFAISHVAISLYSIMCSCPYTHLLKCLVFPFPVSITLKNPYGYLDAADYPTMVF